jgi:uncharacterized protein (DUF2147 family)
MPLLMSMLAAAALSPDMAVGRWQTPTRHGVVDIAACGPSVCGKLLESDAIRANADTRDVHNRDEALRDRRLKGLTIAQGFTRSAQGWDGGTIYNADDGGTYHATLTLVDGSTMRVKGCIVWPLCKSQTWQKLP